MERHKCKLCLRSFSNGRALGGHMRSHMMNLPVPVPVPPPPPSPPPLRVSESASFSSSPSSSAEEEEEEEEKGLLSYGLRENPKRSIRVVDPEFSFTVADAAGSVVLQDRESETESSKNNPTRRRSKRARNKSAMDHHHHHYVKEKQESVKKFNLESWTEPEPVSSISGTTTEEDVAFCLMMLSRDKWTNQRSIESEEEESMEEEEESMEETDDSEEMKLIMKNNRTRGNYKCETCNKVFRSYQALGGHRASHKKIKSVSITEQENNNNNRASASNSMVERKIHECPVCLRVFSSGQALGGHKRSHVNVNVNVNVNSTSKRSMIDLNLPAPYEEDEYSAVSDADFVNAIRQ